MNAGIDTKESSMTFSEPEEEEPAEENGDAEEDSESATEPSSDEERIALAEAFVRFAQGQGFDFWRAG